MHARVLTGVRRVGDLPRGRLLLQRVHPPPLRIHVVHEVHLALPWPRNDDDDDRRRALSL